MRAIAEVLDRALRGVPLSPRQLELLFSAEGGEREALFRAARQLRRRHFGDRVFLYGFVYLSTFCRNDCRFCWYRRSNPSCRRYRKSEEEVLEASSRLADSGVHLLDLTLSEDPLLRTPQGLETLAGLTARVKAATGLPLMLSPGVLPAEALRALKGAGADWYACYQETHSRPLFRRLRPAQSYAARMRAKRAAREAGLLLEEGILCGVGEGPRDLAASVRAMARLGAQQVRAMRFVPRRGIPLAEPHRGGEDDAALAIAARTAVSAHDELGAGRHAAAVPGVVRRELEAELEAAAVGAVRHEEGLRLGPLARSAAADEPKRPGRRTGLRPPFEGDVDDRPAGGAGEGEGGRVSLGPGDLLLEDPVGLPDGLAAASGAGGRHLHRFLASGGAGPRRGQPRPAGSSLCRFTGRAVIVPRPRAVWLKS